MAAEHEDDTYHLTHHIDGSIVAPAMYAMRRDLAERLAAAALSHKLGVQSIDKVLKKHIRGDGEEPGSFWYALADTVVEGVQSYIESVRAEAQAAAQEKGS